MYVQCERCKTEYDFDDALVSERGTTVKCTNCAHQFRVKRASSGGQQDRWVVTTITGQELIFTSLKELQRAIIAKLVARGDSLARGNASPRVLGAIAELEPFFENAEPGKVPSPAVQEARTTQPRKAYSSRPPPVPGATVPALTPPPKRARSEPPPARARIDTLRPYGDLAAPADPKETLAEIPKAADVVGAPPPDLDDSGETEADPSTARMPSNLVPVAAIAPQHPPQRSAPLDLARTAAMAQPPATPPPPPLVREGPARVSNPPPLPARAISTPPQPPP
ncbi:MAG: zinc-ribbon domain-containing protein, partial [Polyangiaceae bacterium]